MDKQKTMRSFTGKLSEGSVLWSDKKRPFFGLPLSFTKYILYEDRLIVERGLLTFRQEELRLYRIRDISLVQTLFQRIFGVGNVRLDAVDCSGPRLILQDVKDPQKVMRIFSEQTEQERQRNGVRFIEGLDGCF